MKLVAALIVAAFVALIVAASVDASTNGMNDCIDDPKYCRSAYEKAKYWEDWQ